MSCSPQQIPVSLAAIYERAHDLQAGLGHVTRLTMAYPLQGTYVQRRGSLPTGTQAFPRNRRRSPRWVTLATAVAQSSDYYFYNIGICSCSGAAGPPPSRNTARSFGSQAERHRLQTRPLREQKQSLLIPRSSGSSSTASPSAFRTKTAYYGGDSVQLASARTRTVVTPLPWPTPTSVVNQRVRLNARRRSRTRSSPVAASRGARCHRAKVVCRASSRLGR